MEIVLCRDRNLLLSTSYEMTQSYFNVFRRIFQNHPIDSATYMRNKHVNV